MVAVGACLPPPPESQAPETVYVTAGVQGAGVDLSPVEWVPGFSEHQVSVAGQGRRSLAAWLPEADSPRSLIIFLHGAVVPEQVLRNGFIPRIEPHQRRKPRIPHKGRRDGGSQARAFLPCLVTPALDALEPVVLAPVSPDGEWWKRSDTELVLGLVQAARRRWPEAAARSVIMGYSNGGLGTWFFARLYPEHFSAAVPMAFNDTIVGPSPLPIYAIQGADDELFEAEAVRRAVTALERTGQDVTYDEKYRGSHFEPCSYVPELKRAGRWLVEHVWSRSAAVPAP